MKRSNHRVILDVTASVNHASMATLTQDDQTVIVPGAKVNDIVVLGLPAAPTAGIIYNAFVSAADTVKIRASNFTAGTIDPAAATFRIQILRV